MVHTVQVSQIQVVQKNSRSSTGAVCGQGLCYRVVIEKLSLDRHKIVFEELGDEHPDINADDVIATNRIQTRKASWERNARLAKQGPRPRPVHSGTSGELRTCVRRQDWTSDHRHGRCQGQSKNKVLDRNTRSDLEDPGPARKTRTC